MIKSTLCSILMLVPLSVCAQEDTDEMESRKPAGCMEYMLEAQGSGSNGKTPLWLNANKYGLSSLKQGNGYARASITRSISPYNADNKATRTDWGFGADIAVPVNYTSNFVIQQAYVEGRWLHGTLSVGSKQRDMNLKNSRLSSGSQTLGINARPVPQVRLSLEDYWTVPFTGNLLHIKGHIAYGMQTDDSWQHDFTAKRSRYADHVLYHTKAGFLRIGKDPYMYPLSLELGLEMASLFGGNSYSPNGDGTMTKLEGDKGVHAFWNAFIPGGKDATDGNNYKNAEGDQLGSWMIRLNYEKDTWRAGLYAEKFFEDHSAMFILDYDGYGSGEEWQVKKKKKYALYDMKDWMLGFDLHLKYGTWLRNIVAEYLYTKYQSGPMYHDHTTTIPDHIGGQDDFYNHNIYPGWQHWGQVIGNPLYLSPIYNTDGKIYIRNNRFMAFHLGFDGRPTANTRYRMLATYQDGLGTYSDPYLKIHHNVSFLLEGEYRFTGRFMPGWTVKGGYAMDFGAIRGNNQGFQLTVSKCGIIKEKNRSGKDRM